MSARILKSTALTGAMTLLSRISGLARDVLFARLIGAGVAADAFYVALRIPNFFRRIFAEGAFAQAFVPVFVEYHHGGDAARTREFTDHLTGLPDRKALEQRLKRLGEATGAIIIADLDRFTLLNDTLGHPAGDAALVHFANTINHVVRETAQPARIGGEEFAVWLPEADIPSALMVANRIRERFASSSWDWQGRSWPLSASFGVAACPESTRSLDNLMARADAALHQAKKAGRNRAAAAPSQR